MANSVCHVRPELEDIVIRLTGYQTSASFDEMLVKLRQTNPDLARELEMAWNSNTFDAIHAGFAIGFQCGRNPELLIFQHGG